MTSDELKRIIMELWAKTSHNSTDYLKIIFDNYFDENYVAYKIIDGRVVSALMGIPYEFGVPSHPLKGLYLFGLYTEEKFRHKGYMSNLIEDINQRAANNFDFTFLIPVSDLNADYYRRRGYFNSFFRLEERFTSVHDFKNDFILSIADSDERVKSLKLRHYESIVVEEYNPLFNLSESQLIEFIYKLERKPSASVSLCHTQKDLKTIIEDYKIRESKIFISFDPDGQISGVAFVEKDDIKRIRIPAFFVDDTASYFALLDYIKHYYSDYSLSVFTVSGRYIASALIDEVYGAENPEGQDLETVFGLMENQFDISRLMEPYGMVRLLRLENIFHYLALTRKDTEYKIYIKDTPFDKDGQHIIYCVKNGKLSLEKYKNPPEDKNILKLSFKEISELLLRKKESNSLIMEAFGIPRLKLEVNLLLN